MEESELRTDRNPDESAKIVCCCPAYNQPAGVCCDQPVHLCLQFFFWEKSSLLFQGPSCLRCNRFVFATNVRSTSLRHQMDPNSRTCLAFRTTDGSALVAACHHQ